ncbi:unnamed protein product [Malus baccata var. baccata]
MLILMLPCMCCLPRRKKLLEFDFSDVHGWESWCKINTVGSRGARSTRLGVMVTNLGLSGFVEQVGTAVSAELGPAWAKLCTVGGIGPLGSRF